MGKLHDEYSDFANHKQKKRLENDCFKAEILPNNEFIIDQKKPVQIECYVSNYAKYSALRECMGIEWDDKSLNDYIDACAIYKFYPDH
jgi:hypothetical protein